MFSREIFLSDWIVPLKKPRPDIAGFLAAMSGDKVPDKAPLIEYLIDDAVMRTVLEQMMGRKWVDTSDQTEYVSGRMDFTEANLEIINAWLDNQIAFWYHLGYDFIRVEVSLSLPATALLVGDTAAGNQHHKRAWQGLHDGPIKSWEDFETYPWPEVTENNFYIHRYICDHLPEGMGFLSCHAGGVFEHVSRLIGYENLCLFLYDQPDLLRAVTDCLGGLIERYNDHLLELDGLAAIFQGEDFGYNTQTLVSPRHIREYFLPWHKKYAAQAHRAGKKYYFHSCGKIDEIMDDLIDDVGIDAKHSFQDGVSSINEAKERWGDRIALLGGVDVNKLASWPPEKLRRYVRKVIDACSSGGRFAVGAGNSIPSYIPVENYLTMLDEALR